MIEGERRYSEEGGSKGDTSSLRKPEWDGVLFMLPVEVLDGLCVNVALRGTHVPQLRCEEVSLVEYWQQSSVICRFFLSSFSCCSY